MKPLARQRGHKRLGVTVLVTAVLMTGAACTPWTPREGKTAPVTYVLESAPTFAVDPPLPVCETLSIAPPLSAPGYGTARMAYTEKPYRLDYSAYHRWADTPARMLEPLLVQTFEQNSFFRRVTTNAAAALEGDVRLETEVLRLLRVYRDESGSVQFHVRYALIDLGGDGLLSTATVRIEEPVRDTTPYGGAAAANRAADRLLRELAARVRASLEPAGLCPGDDHRNLRQ